MPNLRKHFNVGRHAMSYGRVAPTINKFAYFRQRMKFINTYSADIKRLCALYHVKTLYVFGSIVSDQMTDKSDIDFIVDFDAMELKNYADNYFNLKFSLQDILKRPIDLIEEKAIKNPYFRQAVNNHKELVYGH